MLSFPERFACTAMSSYNFAEITIKCAVVGAGYTRPGNVTVIATSPGGVYAAPTVQTPDGNTGTLPRRG